MKPSDRYMKVVEWSEEDGCYVGTCPGLALGGVHGSSEAAVFAELRQVVDEWIRIQQEDGEPLPPATVGHKYSGRFVLRTGEALHRRLAIEALQAGESLNALCVAKLSRPHSRPAPKRARSGK